MGKYFGTDGFRGEAGITLTADHAYKVGRFLGITTPCASATATTSLPVSSSARTPAAAPICSSIVWWRV